MEYDRKTGRPSGQTAQTVGFFVFQDGEEIDGRQNSFDRVDGTGGWTGYPHGGFSAGLPTSLSVLPQSGQLANRCRLPADDAAAAGGKTG